MAAMAPEPTDILVLERRIARDDLVRLLRLFGDMVKYVVDVERGVVAVGGELHVDAEQVLLEQGSRQADLWGANYYPGRQRAASGPLRSRSSGKEDLSKMNQHAGLSPERWAAFSLDQQVLMIANEMNRAAKLMAPADRERDRKSTRLNSSHGYISYAVFCLKKK